MDETTRFTCLNFVLQFQYPHISHQALLLWLNVSKVFKDWSLFMVWAVSVCVTAGRVQLCIHLVFFPLQISITANLSFVAFLMTNYYISVMRSQFTTMQNKKLKNKAVITLLIGLTGNRVQQTTIKMASFLFVQLWVWSCGNYQQADFLLKSSY